MTNVSASRRVFVDIEQVEDSSGETQYRISSIREGQGRGRPRNSNIPKPEDTFRSPSDALKWLVTSHGIDLPSIKLNADGGEDFSDYSGEEEQESQDIPKEQRTLRTQPYDKSVSDLISMIDDGSLILEPDYQRHYVWDNKKASLLVESILLNIPIPVIYVHEDSEGRWIVVDGLQRLNSLSRFFKKKFKLTGLEVFKELNRVDIDQLNPTAKRILKAGNLRVILIQKESHPEIKYDIFQRLNQGAVKLTEQELRNCIYRGRLNEKIKSLAQVPNFLRCLGHVEPDQRMRDEELVLRFLALEADFDRSVLALRQYPNKMKTFLNTFMRFYQNPTDEQLSSFQGHFVDTIEKVYLVFGASSFRRVTENGRPLDERPNRALFDVQMIGFANVSKDTVVEKRSSIIKAFARLCASDLDFQAAILYGTSDKTRINKRLSIWLKELESSEVS